MNDQFEISKFWNLLDVDFEPIVHMTLIGYSNLIWTKLPVPVPTYVLRAGKRQTCTKFHQDSFKTDRLFCIETAGQTGGQP